MTLDTFSITLPKSYWIHRTNRKETDCLESVLVMSVFTCAFSFRLHATGTRLELEMGRLASNQQEGRCSFFRTGLLFRDRLLCHPLLSPSLSSKKWFEAELLPRVLLFRLQTLKKKKKASFISQLNNSSFCTVTDGTSELFTAIVDLSIANKLKNI